jgi:small subunit ribosomal protein S16
MLVIRFLRTGKKNQPFFRIVVTDKKNPPRGGRFLEIVGFYNPLTKEKNLKQDRIKYWLSVGAKPSDTVHNLLVTDKIIEDKKIPVHKKTKKPSSVPQGGTTEGEEKPSVVPQGEAIKEKPEGKEKEEEVKEKPKPKPSKKKREEKPQETEQKPEEKLEEPVSAETEEKNESSSAEATEDKEKGSE